MQLDPNICGAWEHDSSYRIGFDEVVARFVEPKAPVQRFLDRLKRGFNPATLDDVCAAIGLKLSVANAILADLTGALATTRPHTGKAIRGANDETLGVFIDAGERPFDALAHSIGAIEHWSAAPGPAPDIAIVVKRYLEPLERCATWQEKRIPHLPVQFRERVIIVGPLIDPSHSGPCDTCLSLAELDTDPGLALMSAQLTGVKPATETQLGASLATLAIDYLVRQWRDDAAQARGQQVIARLGNSVLTSSWETRHCLPQSECSCTWDPLADHELAHNSPK